LEPHVVKAQPNFELQSSSLTSPSPAPNNSNCTTHSYTQYTLSLATMLFFRFVSPNGVPFSVGLAQVDSAYCFGSHKHLHIGTTFGNKIGPAWPCYVFQSLPFGR